MRIIQSVKTLAIAVPSLILVLGGAFSAPAAGQALQVSTLLSAEMQTQRSQSQGRSNQMQRNPNANPHFNFHATDWMGADVHVWKGDDTLGRVSDLVIDNKGQVTGVVVASGGMMGMNRKYALVKWSDLEHSMEGNKVVFRVKMDKQAFEQLTAYARN